MSELYVGFIIGVIVCAFGAFLICALIDPEEDQ